MSCEQLLSLVALTPEALFSAERLHQNPQHISSGIPRPQDLQRTPAPSTLPRRRSPSNPRTSLVTGFHPPPPPPAIIIIIRHITAPIRAPPALPTALPSNTSTVCRPTRPLGRSPQRNGPSSTLRRRTPLPESTRRSTLPPDPSTNPAPLQSTCLCRPTPAVSTTRLGEAPGQEEEAQSCPRSGGRARRGGRGTRS